jgi:two-component system sensor histidine kinase RegB
VRLEARCSRDEASITVRDHGRGFAPDMLRHWGEPFRSTRPPGEGLGLGLFFVRRAAILAGGRAEARNHEGGGACVTLVLPVHRNPGEAI